MVRTVRDAIQEQQSDGDLARALRRLGLKVRLDNRTAEELESAAPGPKSIAELERLREITRDMPLPAVLPWFDSPPAPKPDELRGAIEEARGRALAYTASLPDFICNESVRRYESTTGKGNWALKDTLTLQLTYFGHVESYKLTAMNGRKTELTYEAAGGVMSKGEFGSMLLEVFSPGSRTVVRMVQLDHAAASAGLRPLLQHRALELALLPDGGTIRRRAAFPPWRASMGWSTSIARPKRSCGWTARPTRFRTAFRWRPPAACWITGGSMWAGGAFCFPSARTCA